MTDFLTLAKTHITLGIPVIPVRAGHKEPPLNLGGSSNASTDPEQIEAWAAMFPDANVGVVGRLDGILIVDDDAGVVESLGPPVHTRVVESSPGHRQYYFRHTAASAEVGNLTQRGGFSLRAQNFYGLGAGSLHPDGHRYTLLVDGPIAPMPEWLLRALRAHHTAAVRPGIGGGALSWGPLDPKLREDEGRNDDMTRLAGYLWDGEITREEFVEKLAQACEERHDPPYPAWRQEELIDRAMEKWTPKSKAVAVLVGTGQKVETESLAALDDNWRGIFHSHLDFVNAPPLTFAIQGWLQQDVLTMIGGLSGHGKTWIMLQTVRSLLTGEPLFGHDHFKVTQKAGHVVYLVPEVSIGPFKHRLQKTRLMEFVESGKLLIRTLSSPEDVPLSDPRIRRAAAGADVFLDTAVRFFEGDEQSAKDAKVFAATLFGLQKAGARTITGAHHSPKALTSAAELTLENVLRGSGDIGAMLATCWGVWQKEEETNRIYVKNVKPRDFDPVRPFEIQGRPSIDNTGKFEMVCLPGDSGGKGGLREGKQPRPDKLNLQVWIRSRIDQHEPVSVMHRAAQAEGFDVPIGTFKNYVTEMRKQIRTAALPPRHGNGRMTHPDVNSAR